MKNTTTTRRILIPTMCEARGNAHWRFDTPYSKAAYVSARHVKKWFDNDDVQS